jgi:hypothetical protein
LSLFFLGCISALHFAKDRKQATLVLNALCAAHDMKPFYTIDAGEFLVGRMIEAEFPGVSLWFPAKDEGDDILLFNRQAGATCTVQVKVSRDYLMTHMDVLFHPLLECSAWFTPTRDKIANSSSDYWIMGLHSYGHHRLSLLILEPAELLRRYDLIHGPVKRLQSYFSLTKGDNVFETRGLSREQQQRIFKKEAAPNPERDFTSFLNDWSGIKRKLRIS